MRTLLIDELCTIGHVHVCRPANDENFAPLFEGRNLKSFIAWRFMVYIYKLTAFTFTLLFFFFFKSYALCRYMYFYWFNEYFWLSWFKNRVYSVIMRWELTGFKTEHVNSHNNLCPTISQTSSLIFLISADPKIMKLVIDVKFSLAFEKRNEGKENQKSENAWEDSQYLA